MTLNLSHNQSILFFSFVGFFIMTIILILKKIEKNLKREKEKLLYTIKNMQTYLQEIKSLKKSGSLSLEKVDNLVRNVISEKQNIPKDLDYSELLENHEIEKNPALIFLCQKMLNLKYSGKLPNKQELLDVLNLLESIIKKIPQATKEKNEKNNKKQKIKRKSKIFEVLFRRKKENNVIKESSKKIVTKRSSEGNKKLIKPKHVHIALPTVHKIIIPERFKNQDYKKEKPVYKHIHSIDIKDRLRQKIKEIRRINW